MKKRKFQPPLATFAFAVLASALFLAGCSKSNTPKETSAAQSAAVVQPTQTLNNLQTAYNGESNARARYLAFAQKADTDGYRKVASLFRAAARAEEIHADNHAKVIKQLGATPTAEIKTPDVGETATNLDAAIKGESYERDTMYPDFLKQAREDGATDAVRTFNLARNAETEHAKLYSEARGNLNSWIPSMCVGEYS
jgi:rubrerythrin